MSVPMSVYTQDLQYETQGNTDILDITCDVCSIVDSSGITNGIVVVFAPGSTMGITTIEYESGLVHDLTQALQRMAPDNINYQHNERWHDGNGHSHVRASLLGQSETFPIVNGDIVLGTWQQIIFIDLDNRSRSRKLVVQVTGK